MPYLTTCRSLLMSAVLVFTALPGHAQDSEEPAFTEEQQAEIEYYQRIVDALEPRGGAIELGDNLATLHVPDEFYFLDGEDARTVLVDIWGNPPGQNVLGMLMPTGYTPMDYDSWAVTIDYVADGWVRDEDAADIDYDELLADMQQEIREANPERVAEGYGSLELLGWAEAPRYDAANKKLYWAKELQFEDSEETTLNYEIRALGRKGILTMTFVAAGSQLAEINAARDTVLAMAKFNEGNRYSDFDPEIDEVAAYGLGALVAGKVAAKAGLFGGALLLLKKFGIFFVIGLAAFGRKLTGLFRTDTLGPGT